MFCKGYYLSGLFVHLFCNIKIVIKIESCSKLDKNMSSNILRFFYFKPEILGKDCKTQDINLASVTKAKIAVGQIRWKFISLLLNGLNETIQEDQGGGGHSLLCSTHDFHIVICEGFSNFHHDFYIPTNRNKEGGRRHPCIFKGMTYKLHITFSHFLLVKIWSHDTSR